MSLQNRLKNEKVVKVACKGQPVSAVLLNWKRPAELTKVVEHLTTTGIVDEVIVWNNAVGDNIEAWGRYVGAKDYAKNEIIYLQDDDCIVSNVKDIWGTWDQLNLSVGLKASHYDGRECWQFGDGYETLVAWGAFFNKSWLKVLEPYIAKWGVEDDVFKENVDRVFTTLLRRKHNVILSNVAEFESSLGKMAMHKREGYMARTRIARERVCQLLHIGGR
jgi:hypothetical protein